MVLHKKILALSAAAGVIAVLMSLQAMAYEKINTVRVGLESSYKEVSSVKIAESDIDVGFEKSGNFEKIDELKGSFSISLAQSTIINANEYYPSYDDAIKACDDIEKLWGYKAAAGMTNEDLWGVFVYEFGKDDEALAADTLKGEKVSDSKIVVLYDNNEPKLVFDGVNPQIKSADNEATALQNKSYRGVLEFGRYSGKKITVVNSVGMEDYLKGVVPSEMPASWNEEALKAQAVAARTYVYSRRSAHESEGYDVCDTTNCQVYGGFEAENQNSSKAVDDTKNEVAIYNGEPIFSVFFSSSGGSTDDCANVWGTDFPYLKAVNDKYETGVTKWTRTYTASEMTAFMNRLGKGVGNVEKVEVSEEGNYGRIQSLKVTGSSKTVTLTKEETRTFCSSSADGSLPSRMYTVKSDIAADSASDNNNPKVFIISDNDISLADVKNVYFKSGGKAIKGFELDGITVIVSGEDLKNTVGTNNVESKKKESSAKATNTVVFTGSGIGHGVGMSQYGAKGMAENGFDYKQILEYYYTGIDVE